MYRRKHRKKLLCFLIFLVVSSGMFGCSYDRKNYGFQPTLYDRGLLRSLGTGTDTSRFLPEKTYTINGMKVEYKDDYIHIKNFGISIPRSTTPIKITDADVLGFTDDVKKILQFRSNLARRFRLGSGTGQILAAAAGATLGLIAHANVETVAALAAVSAVIPEIQTIWDARARAATYNDGLDLIQKAEARYYEEKAKKGGIIDCDELTPEGVELLKQVTASIQVIGKVLVDLIPTVEELQAATGKLKDELEQIKIVPDEPVNLMYKGTRTQTQTIHVLYGKAIAYSIDGVDVVEIDPTDFKQGIDKFDIKGVGSGTAKVTIFNSHGKSKNINVTVVRKIPVANAGKDQTVTVGSPVTLKGSGTAPDRNKIDEYEWNIVEKPKDSHPDITGTQTVKFTPDKIGDYKVTLTVKDEKGEYSDPSTVTITAENKKPTANAGEDKTAKVGETVELDGSKSTDPEGGKLSYKWEMKSPSDSSAKIEKQEDKTSFTADKPGEYIIKLIVNDGYTDSDPDEVTINVAQ